MDKISQRHQFKEESISFRGTVQNGGENMAADGRGKKARHHLLGHQQDLEFESGYEVSKPASTDMIPLAKAPHPKRSINPQTVQLPSDHTLKSLS